MSLALFLFALSLSKPVLSFAKGGRTLFLPLRPKKGQGFDKLSPNGMGKDS